MCFNVYFLLIFISIFQYLVKLNENETCFQLAEISLIFKNYFIQLTFISCKNFFYGFS